MKTRENVSNFRSTCDKAGLALIVDCPPLAREEAVYVRLEGVGRIGLRQAMGIIVLAGIVAAGPMLFPLESASRSANEEAVTT
jgi:hypothetical protein